MPNVEQPTILFLQRWNSADGPRDFSIHSYRNTIADLVDNFLTDLDDVVKSLETDGNASGSLRSLTMCLEFLRENGEIFHHISSESSTSENLRVLQEENTSQAFCYWFLRHLLRLLGHSECGEVHAVTIKLVIHILQAIKLRHVFVFRQHVTELVKTCGELVALSDRLYAGEQTVALTSFYSDIDLAQQSLRSLSEGSKDELLCENKIKKVDVTISDPKRCELLQVNIVKIFNGMLLDVCQIAGSSVDVIWGCLFCNVENGDVELKAASLECLASLLSIRGLPLISATDYFLQCIIAFWELMCSGCSVLDNSEKEILERSGSEMLSSLIHSDTRGLLPSRQTFFRQFTEKVCMGGLDNLLTVQSKRTLVSMFVHLLRGIPSSDLFDRLNRPATEILISHAVGLMASASSCEYLIPLLYELTLMEVGCGSSQRDTDYSSSSQDSATQRRTSELGSLAHSKKKADTSLSLKRTSFHMYDRILEKETELTSDRGCPTMLEIKCHLTVVEVGARCLQALHARGFAISDKTHHPFLKEFIINSALDCWIRYLKSVASNSDSLSSFIEKFSVILRSIEDILLVQEFHPMPMMVLQELSWILTLPWLANDFSWKDLKPLKPKEVGNICASLVEKLDVETTCRCLSIMALLPKETAVSWRAHIISQAMNDNNETILKTAVRCFPVLLHQLGPKSGHLVDQLFVPLLNHESVTVCQELAERFGEALLAKANVTKLRRCAWNAGQLDCADVRVEVAASNTGKVLKLEEVTPFFSLLTRSGDFRLIALRSLTKVLPFVDLSGSETLKKSTVASCLKLVEDDARDIRLECCSLIPCLVTAEARLPVGKPSVMDNQILQHLERLCSKTHLGRREKAFLETALTALGQFGRVVEGSLLQSVVVRLLEHRLSRQLNIASVAFTQLEQIAAHKKESLQQIYVRFKGAICKFMVEEIYVDQQNTGGTNGKSILMNIARTLEADDLKAFLQGNEKFMVPFLVSKGSPESTKLLKLIAVLQSSSSSRRSLLINNTKYIFSYLVRFCQKEEMEKAFLYLQTETDFSLGNLLRLDFQRVHNELLLHLSTHHHQVFSGLKTLATYDEKCKSAEEIQTSEQMALYLEPRLLGVLAFFDTQLMNSNITMGDKELALKSVISIIQLMGSKHISTIRHKVMNTLRLGLQFTEKPFTEISCKAWNCFVRSLELPLLGVMMSQIIATLLPLLQCLPEQVAQIFDYMIVENRAVLSKHFHEIYFLPDIPELTDAKKVLTQHGDSFESDRDLRLLLAHCIKGVQHESLDVREHALSKLRNILRDKQMEIKNYLLNNEQAEPVISHLVSALLNGCRDSDSRTQILYGHCLGELGAIDPGRLELITNKPSVKLADFHASIDEDKFAFSLINIVVKAFLAATEPRVQDCAALALQELLQIYGISESGSTQGVSPHSRLWKMFPEQTQEILIPLFSSKYRLTVDTDYANYPKPLYGSERGKNFKDWVSNWTGYLSSKVKPGKARQVFTACSATKRHSMQVALHVLPHVVLQVLLDGSTTHVKQMFEELMEVLNYMQKPETRLESASNFHHLSAQTVFSILDYLTMWCNHRAQSLAATTTAAAAAKGINYEKDAGYQAVRRFLDKIPQELFAQACYNCKAYTRALRHFEVFITTTKDIQPHLDFMQRLYVSMDEPDGVLGVATVRMSQPTLMQQILMYESLGLQQDAQACCEIGIQMEPEEISHYHGLLRSLIDLAQPHNALVHTAGLLAERPRWTAELNTYRIEAALKLGSWDKLDEALKHEKQSSRSWPVLVGRVLKAAKEKRAADFIEQLDLARREQMGPLSAASMEIGSYHRGYENILRLHMISEIEQFFQVVSDFPEERRDEKDLDISSTQLLDSWQSRLQMAQSSFRSQEPILTLRRTLLSLVQSERDPSLDVQIGKWWLWSAKVARKAGYLQSAYGCLLQANSYNLPDFFLEKAKWLREKGEPEAAISCLEKGITEHFGGMTQPGQIEALNRPLKEVYAKSLLLYAKYNEEASNLETNSIVKQYKEVYEVCPEWEDGYFHLAKYYDRIMVTFLDDKERAEKQGEFVIHVVRFFGQSLKYGNEHIYQSMPRLLSLWLDSGTAVAEAERKDKGKVSSKLQTLRTVLNRINSNVQQLSQQLAPYQFFTAFPQLISRICHARVEVFQLLQDIIASLLLQYPQQALWMMMAVSKSSYLMRVKRCQEIFATAIGKQPDLNKFIQDCKKLTERLLELCEKDFGSNMTVSLSQMFKPLKRLLEGSNFSKILLPLQSAVTVNLPATVAEGLNHNPFPDDQIYIQGFEDTIEVLPSLQKPKKITMIGSDGKRYVMMCKPKDDLRKDCRLMEFNAIINKFLRRDAESRKRRLLIRTYTVTPLNEECGLIEWVNNTTGLRHILVKLYKEKGLYMSGKELKALMPSLHSSLETKMTIYKEKLLPRHPQMLPEWFMRTFPDPTSWYSARVSYARTAAVMSIVGYILGLGDRHGENILFDSHTGDCVHVDFNCLFNKGETFEWPERVPFRLTPNMTAALGPLGYEGLFRRACEMTLQVIRDQMDPLMSVLRPFIYDPLVEWSKPVKGQRSNASDSGEINNEQALNHVQNIEDRMRGILKTKAKPRCLPLSIKGHVNYLIQEATDEKNLCQMYIGWAAYM
ncbi:serine/threonine-protein kinase ATR [Aplysia californica]|uniref:Serine/threonine-protein kinase ATR n=1 Tax=Aplysia californica TaxID=6500 RepID=A0ABM0ZYH8_APLCA|nr:serine/threonine-protein kinase ATR [Aplysia californica]